MMKIEAIFLINLAIFLILIRQVIRIFEYSGFLYWFNIFFISLVGTYVVIMTTSGAIK